jgi:DNA topoisomerase-2
LVNAADNKQRDKRMSRIMVEIDEENGQIVVENDGQGVPVVMHAEHGVYVPELIFGHLLTSSNYDDTQKKSIPNLLYVLLRLLIPISVTGGRNGYGAKLANIFSTEFKIESADSSRKLQYSQV